jgi:CheY-like chemotaxis protein
MLEEANRFPARFILQPICLLPTTYRQVAGEAWRAKLPRFGIILHQKNTVFISMCGAAESEIGSCWKDRLPECIADVRWFFCSSLKDSHRTCVLSLEDMNCQRISLPVLNGDDPHRSAPNHAIEKCGQAANRPKPQPVRGIAPVDSHDWPREATNSAEQRFISNMRKSSGLQQAALWPGRKSSRPVRILITDDHAGLRHGLRQILADAFPCAVFGEAGSGHETLEKLAESSWDCVLIDVTMPDKSGWNTMRAMRLTHPTLPVLALSEDAGQSYSQFAQQSGANGCLSKENAPEQLVSMLLQMLSAQPSRASDQF